VLGQMATDEKMRTQPVFVIEDRNNPEAIKEVETATRLLKDLAKIVVEYGPGNISIPSCLERTGSIVFSTRALPMTVVHITGHNFGGMTPARRWITMYGVHTCVDFEEPDTISISASLDGTSIVIQDIDNHSNSEHWMSGSYTHLFTCAHGFAWTDHSESSNKTKQISH
jgi:hypothetical protein